MPAPDNMATLTEALRRRTFAVISHPDAGKSTLTEALLLHASAIDTAGAVHGKHGRHATVSDWIGMEKERGISISSAAIQFEYRDTILNIVDTPGHADFSEDTFRVMSAVDAAIILIDAARGMETQTMRLFEVCRQRGIPLITVINKWDRPGRDALDLLDELAEKTGLLPTPLTWPIGEAGAFSAVVDRSTGDAIRFARTAGGATVAPERRMSAAEAGAIFGEAWDNAVEETALLSAAGHNHDQGLFLDQQTTPVVFAAAVLNFGVAHLLDVLVDIVPSAGARVAVGGRRRPVNADFSGYVFKVQSGMDPAHRDRVAFMRVCSGTFHRGMTVTHSDTGRPFATKYAQQLFGRERTTVELAFPGDIVGLVNANALRVGDSLYSGEPVTYPRLPSFTPQHFRLAKSSDTGKNKQFRKGIEQLDHEGVIQVLHSETRGEGAPILGAVGPMQFEVVESRMRTEFHAPVDFQSLSYAVARVTDAESAAILAQLADVEVLARADGTLLAVTTTPWRLRTIQRQHPQLRLDEAV